MSNKNPPAQTSHDSDKGDDHTSHSCILSALGQRLASSCLKHRTQRIHGTGRQMGEMGQQGEDYRVLSMHLHKVILLSLDRSSLDPNPGLQLRLGRCILVCIPLHTHIHTPTFMYTQGLHTHIHITFIYTLDALSNQAPLGFSLRKYKGSGLGLIWLRLHLSSPQCLTPSMTENSLLPMAIPSIPEIKLFQGPAPEALRQSWVH